MQNPKPDPVPSQQIRSNNQEICYRGHNIITNFQVRQSKLTVKYMNKLMFEVPFDQMIGTHVVQCDLVMEMDEMKFTRNSHNLSELRFYVPNNLDEEETEDTSADRLGAEIKKHVKVDERRQDLIYTFADLPFLVPRGKYSLQIFDTYFKLHGISYNYNIKYKNMLKCFLLPLPDKSNLAFVLAFKNAMTQGRTNYRFMIMMFPKSQFEEVRSDLKGIQLQMVNENLKEKYRGIYYEIFATIFRLVSRVDIVIPDDFRSTKDCFGIPCSMKANQGTLFILRKSIIYIYKPQVVHELFADIVRVVFHRLNSGGINKGFDFEIRNRQGNNFVFGDIDKTEADNIMAVFRSQKIPITTAEDGADEQNDSFEMDTKYMPIDVDEEEKKKLDGFLESDESVHDSEDEDEDFDPQKFKELKDKKIQFVDLK